MRTQVWKHLKHLADRPWASAFGILLLAQVFTTLTGSGLTADVLKGLVPGWLLLTLSVAYGIGGLCLVIAIGWGRSDYESAACILIATGLLVRGVAILYVIEFSAATVSAVVFYGVFMWACIERFRQILRGERIIHTSAEVKLKLEEDN